MNSIGMNFECGSRETLKDDISTFVRKSGRDLRTIREEAKLTRSQFAVVFTENTGVEISEEHVAAWEEGEQTYEGWVIRAASEMFCIPIAVGRDHPWNREGRRLAEQWRSHGRRALTVLAVGAAATMLLSSNPIVPAIRELAVNIIQATQSTPTPSSIPQAQRTLILPTPPPTSPTPSPTPTTASAPVVATIPSPGTTEPSNAPTPAPSPTPTPTSATPAPAPTQEPSAAPVCTPATPTPAPVPSSTNESSGASVSASVG